MAKARLKRLCAAVRAFPNPMSPRPKTPFMESGYNAEVYQRPAAEICDELITLARRVCRRPEWCFLDPLAELAGAPRNSCGSDISTQ